MNYPGGREYPLPEEPQDTDRERHWPTKFGVMTFGIDPLGYRNSNDNRMFAITAPWGEVATAPHVAINTVIRGLICGYEAQRFAQEARKARGVG